MAKWSLKNDQNQNQNQAPDMPPELSNYYREEKRDRMWGAWALGFGTLVVTIAVGVGLFMGGKWLFNQFNDEGEVKSPATTQSDVSNTQDTGSSGNSSQDDEAAAGQSGSSDVASNTDSEGVVSDEAAVSTNDLPDTGPGDTLAVFLAVAFLGTIGHSLATKRR